MPAPKAKVHAPRVSKEASLAIISFKQKKHLHYLPFFYVSSSSNTVYTEPTTYENESTEMATVVLRLTMDEPANHT